MSEQLEKYQRLLEQFPGNELARFSLAKAFYDLGRFEEAKQNFSIALKAKPDWMVVQILLGRCDLALGNKREAIQAFEKARDLAIVQHHEGPLAEMEELLDQLDRE
jgi:tetratricopeptide (TPR) repeat protein